MKPYKYIELAIQHAPDNPVAVYLFRPVSQLLNTEVTVRVGGSFVFPPAGDIPFKIVVFVASGMGINPLISMMSWLGEQGKDSRWRGLEVRVLYGARVSRDAWSQEAVGAEMALKPANSLLDPCKIPFLPRIAKLFSSGKLQGQVTLFLTGLNSASNPTGDVIPCENLEIAYLRRRMTLADVQAAIGEKKGQDNSVVYVCGVPVMTDEFVGRLAAPEPEGFGMDKRRVLFEKWW
jgi:Flavodoxin reductases (ferredoxin-NADPH reductases) family 1